MVKREASSLVDCLVLLLERLRTCAAKCTGVMPFDAVCVTVKRPAASSPSSALTIATWYISYYNTLAID